MPATPTVPDARPRAAGDPPAPEPAAPLFVRPFDDLEEGLAFATAPRRVLQEEIDAFAALTGDHQPIHVDADYAAAGPFGGRVAHGLLVLSLALGALPLRPERLLALRRVRETTFKRPVPSGAAIVVAVEIDALRPMGEEAGIVGLRGAVRLAEGDRLAIRFGLDVLWAREADPGTTAPAGSAAEVDVGTARDVAAPAAPAGGLAPGLAVPL